jgi:hypothetical protein
MVEILMALSILSVVLMSLGALMFQVGRQTRVSAQVGYRSAAIHNAAAWARALPWDSIPLKVGWSPNDTIGQLIFQRNMTYVDSATIGYRTLTVIVQPVTAVASSARVKPETLRVVRAKPRTTAPLKVK